MHLAILPIYISYRVVTVNRSHMSSTINYTQLWYSCVAMVIKDHVMIIMMCCIYTVFSSAQLALNVDNESYALIFGFNTFIALVFETILTLVVSDKHGLDLDVRTQVRRLVETRTCMHRYTSSFVVYYLVTNSIKPQNVQSKYEPYLPLVYITP